MRRTFFHSWNWGVHEIANKLTISMKNDETQHMGKMGPYGWNLIIWNYMAMLMQFNDIGEIMSPIGLCGWT
jgi:hypothetical protein